MIMIGDEQENVISNQNFADALSDLWWLFGVEMPNIFLSLFVKGKQGLSVCAFFLIIDLLIFV